MRGQKWGVRFPAGIPNGLRLVVLTATQPSGAPESAVILACAVAFVHRSFRAPAPQLAVSSIAFQRNMSVQYPKSRDLYKVTAVPGSILQKFRPAVQYSPAVVVPSHTVVPQAQLRAFGAVPSVSSQTGTWLQRFALARQYIPVASLHAAVVPHTHG